MKTHLIIGKAAMTHSTAINSTITKETEATNVSPFEQSGFNKNEMSLEQRKSLRALKIIERLREIHGLKREKKPVSNFNPLDYVCTENACVDLHRY
ncbi:hypothetical protein [Aliivibrio fischeri]|uniref:Uncharacterized protein n=1 Tax=Aliivibrio fischeri TaxID=668 RepID=A0A510UNA8_ALIFS|nr:hypothetical protein [Aliivibrio fischeri]GEK16104.1 hypothetical protein AFI02nite_41400 [Aliivibrio fischeri]